MSSFGVFFFFIISNFKSGSQSIYDLKGGNLKIEWRTMEFCLRKFYVSLPDHQQQSTHHPRIRSVFKKVLIVCCICVILICYRLFVFNKSIAYSIH